jgi:hypothetical protein
MAGSGLAVDGASAGSGASTVLRLRRLAGGFSLEPLWFA